MAPKGAVDFVSIGYGENQDVQLDVWKHKAGQFKERRNERDN